eukprot:9436228-Pyramimonas_sp.AAC.1
MAHVHPRGSRQGCCTGPSTPTRLGFFRHNDSRFGWSGRVSDFRGRRDVAGIALGHPNEKPPGA